MSGIQRPDQGRYREDESPGQGCLSRICSCLTSAINESCGAIPARSRKRIALRATHTSCTTAQRCQKTKLARSRRARRVQHLSRARLHHYSDLLLAHCPRMARSRSRESCSPRLQLARGSLQRPRRRSTSRILYRVQFELYREHLGSPVALPRGRHHGAAQSAKSLL